MTALKIKPPHYGTLTKRSYPLLIKYMGSKSSIIDFVVEGINQAYQGGKICDLFAGSCSLSGALGNSVPIISNDIQSYSKILGSCYLLRLSSIIDNICIDDMVEIAGKIVSNTLSRLPVDFSNLNSSSLHEFNIIEERNRELLECSFDNKYHLFLKFYSGTWWSAEQCAWIDALRQVSDEYLEANKIQSSDHALILTSIMHAMAYCSQGTGHFAQYRDAKTISSMNDINLYRRKSVPKLFTRKLEALLAWNNENVGINNSHELHSLDFKDCLKSLDGGTVYADPPYAFVHYSRFYHALETFVLYDYPDLQIKGGKIVKGRYREMRHQSPFSIKTQVPGAFKQLFNGVSYSKANIVLSYSNSGLFNLDELIKLAHEQLGNSYDIRVLNKNHNHMTMGRKADRTRNVEEALIIGVRN